MIVNIGRRKWKVKAMDVESHNDEESIAKKETSIWLGCYIDENDDMNSKNAYFYTIDEFLDKLSADTIIKRNKAKTRLVSNVVCYIYNLSFEWSFILPVLLNRGFVFNEKIKFGKDDEYCFNSISTKTCSSVWEVNLKFGKKQGLVKLRDLAKHFGGGLGKVAKSFGLETQKGEIDYRLNRLHNYVVTDEEREYCFKDTRIIIEILMKLQNDKEFFNTISMASYSMKKCLKYGYRSFKPYQKFRRDYPKLNDEESRFLRKSVEGGITYSPPKWQFVDIQKPVLHIDAHQMYPSQMVMKAYPFGRGEYFKGKPPLSRICCCHCLISYDDVKLHSKVQLIGLQANFKYEIWLWNVEIPTMQKVYKNLKIEYIDGYAYKIKMLPFRKYYQSNYEARKIAKKNGDVFNILYYKLLNNSSYGKFIENGHNSIFKNIVRDDGIIDSETIPKDEIELNARYTYIPIGAVTTAYARVCLIETALKFGWEKVLYFDTDSIFVLYDEETKKVWSTINQNDELGGWGLEEINQRAMFTAPKRYKLESDGKTIVKAGGINFKKYLQDNNLDELSYEVNITSSSWQVQRAYRVKGGTLIDFQLKKMDIPAKYQYIYKNNKDIIYN